MLFRIKHRISERFSKGGQDANKNPNRWSSNCGKIWSSIGALRLHLRQYHLHQIQDWEVIAIDDENFNVITILPAANLYEPGSKV